MPKSKLVQMSQFVRARVYIDTFFVEVFHKPLQITFYCFYIGILDDTLLQIWKESSKAFSKTTQILLRLHHRGDGLQVSVIMHLRAFWCSLQVHCWAIGVQLRFETKGKQWPWIRSPDDCMFNAGAHDWYISCNNCLEKKHGNVVNDAYSPIEWLIRYYKFLEQCKEKKIVKFEDLKKDFHIFLTKQKTSHQPMHSNYFCRYFHCK